MSQKNFKFFVLALISLFVLSGTKMSSQNKDLQVVDGVDLQKYLGTWYEIASMPQFFQRKCIANTTATYSLKEDGSIDVFNQCQTEKGMIGAHGNAIIDDQETKAKLKVTFFHIFSKWVYWTKSNYWIIDLAPDYSWAVVGHPSRHYGWILSRTPDMKIETLRAIEIKLRAQGYDTCDFFSTPQKDGLLEKTPLCHRVSESHE